jgi:hypothetical protein
MRKSSSITNAPSAASLRASNKRLNDPPNFDPIQHKTNTRPIYLEDVAKLFRKDYIILNKGMLIR